MCTCNGKPVRYLVCRRNTILAFFHDEEEALQAAKQMRGFVCVDATSKSDAHMNVELIRTRTEDSV
jgi:hypothetical protein